MLGFLLWLVGVTSDLENQQLFTESPNIVTLRQLSSNKRPPSIQNLKRKMVHPCVSPVLVSPLAHVQNVGS